MFCQRRSSERGNFDKNRSDGDETASRQEIRPITSRFNETKLLQRKEGEMSAHIHHSVQSGGMQECLKQQPHVKGLNLCV